MDDRTYLCVVQYPHLQQPTAAVCADEHQPFIHVDSPDGVPDRMKYVTIRYPMSMRAVPNLYIQHC